MREEYRVVVSALGACGGLVVRGSDDKTVRCMEVSTGKEKWVSEEH
eukprot:COSAG04_NODE_28714_length_274_cov_0.554286_2_plen_45_part_01